jgi:ABC-type multidrug transport system ATPase subunit/pSer/pThr/pTyr-binding forkhead associated (FHA) protein
VSNEQDHLVITTGPRTGEKIPLANLPLVIGRILPADVIISIEGVSRKHARIARDAAGYTIEDLGSSNGTFLNNERLQTLKPILNGDLIRLGLDIELRLVALPEPKSEATVLKAPAEATVLNAQAGPATAVQEPSMAEASPGTVVSHSPVDAANNQASAAKNRTILGGSAVIAETPPQLVVNESGQEPKIYTITGTRLRIGRLPENDVVLNNHFVSRYHAELEKRGNDYYLIPMPNIRNALLLDGVPVMEPARLRHGMKIRIGGWDPGEMASLDYLAPQDDADLSQQKIRFSENNVMTIGRNPDNKIVLPAPTVSSFHAEVEKVGQRFRVRDLRSSNGTFVNGKSISGEVWVHPGDAIQIGPYRFVVDEHEFAKSDQSEGGVKVEVFGLNKWVTKKLNIIQDTSLIFKPKEFIVVVGQSGGGKSTLVDAITGYRPATHGKVIVNGSIDVYKEFDAIRSTIGYVPQKDIIHMELTVFEALDYAAQLRMPSDTTREERLKRIDEVMDDLDMKHRRDTQISQLSGGQQKRVSIGVELLTKPGLFFLDEPTSGLDPGMETELMRLMRRLADQGRTIVMITHATKNVMLADKVVFLARGGYLSWFGPPEEALAYFDKYRTDRDRRSSPMEFDHIYTLLDQEELGKAADWAKRFRENPAYNKYIAGPLSEGKSANQNKPVSQTASKLPNQQKQVSALRQFFILSSRNIKILTRDRFSLALLLVTAPLMASLDFMLASGAGRNPLAFKNGSFNDLIITLIVLTNTTILVGGLAFMRELVKERDIYKRERMVNLQLSPYLLSKIWIAFALALYQAGCYTVIRYLAFDVPGGNEEKLFFYITVFLLILAGTMMGFFASALAPNANSAPLLLIMFIIPQMVLSGALVPLPSTTTAIASSRWAFQASVAIGGAGSDVAADRCWSLTKAEQDKLTLDQKNANCTCMGENALRQSSCNFPGLGKYYDVAIDTKDPAKPAEPGPQPEQPKFPAAPDKPADPNNILLLQKYLSDLTTYNDKVSKIRDDYQTKIDAWKKEQDSYKTAIETYQKDLTELKVKRAIAVGSAESTIQRYKDEYGWTFINKNDRQKYLNTLYTTWGAQLLISLVLFIGTVIMQKRREA